MSEISRLKFSRSFIWTIEDKAFIKLYSENPTKANETSYKNDEVCVTQKEVYPKFSRIFIPNFQSLISAAFLLFVDNNRLELARFDHHLLFWNHSMTVLLSVSKSAIKF